MEDSELIAVWKAVHEYATTLAASPMIRNASIEYTNGFFIFVEEGKVRIATGGQALTPDQIPGYIAALEGES